MYRIFLSPYNAQVVTLAAKVVVVQALGEICTIISYWSSSGAFIFTFFSSFENISALLTDMRWYPSVRKHRTATRTIHKKTWAMMALAIALAGLALISDLLLFQFTAQKQTVDVQLTTKNFTFPDVTDRNSSVPAVLISNATAQDTFHNKKYLSHDKGYYQKFSPYFRDGYIVDSGSNMMNVTAEIGQLDNNGTFSFEGPYGTMNVTSSLNNTALRGPERCVVVHRLAGPTIIYGGTPVFVSCFVDQDEQQSPIPDLLYDLLGTQGETITTFFQTAQGANYLFVNMIRRTFQNLDVTENSQALNQLRENLASLTQDGYHMEIANINDLFLTNSSHISPLDLMSQYAPDCKDDLCVGVFLYSKLFTSKDSANRVLYSRRYYSAAFYYSTDTVILATMSYETRQKLVPNKKIRHNLVHTLYDFITSDGLSFTGDVPISNQIATDLSDDEIILATLENPAFPLRLVVKEYQNALPAFIVIFSCVLFILVSWTIQLIYRRNAHTHLPFDANLEMYHKALENINGLNAWNLSAKFELDTNVVMTRGRDTMDKFTIGLDKKNTAESQSGFRSTLDYMGPESARNSLVPESSSTADQSLLSYDLSPLPPTLQPTRSDVDNDKIPLVSIHRVRD